MTIRTRCPYCNLDNQRNFNESVDEGRASYLEYCDEDEGGCGLRFVIDRTVVVTVKILTVEGEAEKYKPAQPKPLEPSDMLTDIDSASEGQDEDIEYKHKPKIGYRYGRKKF